MIVKEFCGEMQLSTIKDRTEFVEIDDLDDVAVAINDVQVNTINEAQVVGVFSIECFSVCLKYNGKVVGEEIGTCNRCSIIQCMDDYDCDVAAKIMIKGKEGSAVLKIYGKVLQEKAGVKERVEVDSQS